MSDESAADRMKNLIRTKPTSNKPKPTHQTSFESKRPPAPLKRDNPDER